MDTLKWLREELHCPWNPYDVAAASLASLRDSPCILQYLYDQGEVLPAEELESFLCCSVIKVKEAADLGCAKWLRDHGADWPVVLEFLEVDEDEEPIVENAALKDWPQPAIDWARSEGCTAPLWSETIIHV